MKKITKSDFLLFLDAPRHLWAAAHDRMDAVPSALDRLVTMGWLLEARLAGAAGPERWLLLNAPEGRAARERLLAGATVLAAAEK